MEAACIKQGKTVCTCKASRGEQTLWGELPGIVSFSNETEIQSFTTIFKQTTLFLYKS